MAGRLCLSYNSPCLQAFSCHCKPICASPFRPIVGPVCPCVFTLTLSLLFSLPPSSPLLSSRLLPRPLVVRKPQLLRKMVQLLRAENQRLMVSPIQHPKTKAHFVAIILAFLKVTTSGPWFPVIGIMMPGFPKKAASLLVQEFAELSLPGEPRYFLIWSTE